MKTWAKEEYKFEVERTFQDLKSSGFTKGQAKKEVDNVMKQEGITIKK